MDTMSEQIAELAMALSKAQAELQPAQKNAKNPMLRNRYADLASCIEAAKDILAKNGLSISQVLIPSERGTVTVKTILLHSSGQWLASDVTMSCVGNKGVNEAQAAGSAITYARRYGYCGIIGLVADDDDDGCNASPMPEQKPRTQSTSPSVEDIKKAFYNKLRTQMEGITDPAEKSKHAIEVLSKYFQRQLGSYDDLSPNEMWKYAQS